MFFLFSIVKTVIRYFSVVISFITTFLLGYLLIGCSETSSIYSRVYLTKFEFNSTSEYFHNIESSFNGTSRSALTDLSLSVGYLNYCLGINGNQTCSSFNNIGSISSVAGVSIVPSSSQEPTQLNIAVLAKAFHQMCHPNVLMAAIVVGIVVMILLCCCAIPIVPKRAFLRKMAGILAFANILLWGLGSMLQHEAVLATQRLVGPASMGIIVASTGKRAEAMTWTGFSFVLVVFLCVVAMIVEDMREKKKDQVVMPYIGRKV